MHKLQQLSFYGATLYMPIHPKISSRSVHHSSQSIIK